MTGQELGLKVRNHAQRRGLPQERVAQLVALAFLPCNQHAFSGVVGHPHAAGLLDREIVVGQLAAID